MLLTDFLLGLEMNRYLILAMIMVMIFLLGWPLEWVPIVYDYSTYYNCH